MTDSVKKNYTIKDAATSDIDSFKALQAEKNLSQAGTFKYCIESALKPNVNQVDTQSLLERIQQLTEENQGLLTQNEGLLESNTELTAQVNLLSTELETSKEQGKLSENQFVVTPTGELYKKMRRAITYLIRKGKLDRHAQNLPEQFTQQCIDFTIDEKYSTFLK